MDAPSVEAGTDRAISRLRAAFVAALRSGDDRAASSLYAEEGYLIAPSAEAIRGRDAIAAFWAAGLAAGVRDVELEAVEVRRGGSLAYELGRYVLRVRPDDGREVIDRGTYLLVLERLADGNWRRAVEMFSPGKEAA